MTNELSTHQKLLVAETVVNTQTEQLAKLNALVSYWCKEAIKFRELRDQELKARADLSTQLVETQEDRRVILSEYLTLLARLKDILDDNVCYDDGRGYPHHVVHAQDVLEAIEAASHELYARFNFNAMGL
jgi:hypothetical protein